MNDIQTNAIVLHLASLIFPAILTALLLMFGFRKERPTEGFIFACFAATLVSGVVIVIAING